MPGYYDGESVSGRVGIRLKDGRKFQHDGIRIELIGMLSYSMTRRTIMNLYRLSQELPSSEELRQAQSFEFTLKMWRSNLSPMLELTSGSGTKSE
ncbi:uncharacterized protein IAS62_005130 [Cryptococcus decagattii]|uniref:Uncharacterized protein n=1 Tax=Cryptococcus decagattii TaxID=1859122 RepID=A0ABZ2AZ52_9TREE